MRHKIKKILIHTWSNRVHNLSLVAHVKLHFATVVHVLVTPCQVYSVCMIVRERNSGCVSCDVTRSRVYLITNIVILIQGMVTLYHDEVCVC